MVWLGALLAAAMGAAALAFVQLAADRAGGDVGLLERSRCPRCAAMLLGSPLRAAGRPLLAGLLPALGVALLASGVARLLEGR